MIKYEVKVYEDGSKYWYLNGKYHREDGPAIEWADGGKQWYLNDQLHRKQEFLSRSIKEMTMAEVIEKLGYDIKIIKG